MAKVAYSKVEYHVTKTAPDGTVHDYGKHIGLKETYNHVSYWRLCDAIMKKDSTFNADPPFPDNVEELMSSKRRKYHGEDNGSKAKSY